MTRRIILFFFLVFTMKACIAQDTAQYRNSISIDTKSYLVMLCGYKPVAYHQLTYMRSHNRYDLRLGADVRYKGRNGRFDAYSDLWQNNFWDRRVDTDTFQSRLFASNRIKGVYTLRPGADITFGKKKFKQVLGADLLLGVISMETIMEYYESHNDTGTITWSTRSRYAAGNNIVYRIGIAPFYGFRYSFSTRCYLEMHTGITAESFAGRLKFKDQNGEVFTARPSTSFQFDVSGFINNISLGFRF
jgi:hypothetical protein